MTASEYGRHLGLAFQLVDDLLDFVSSSTDMGKPVASDLKLGKFWDFLKRKKSGLSTAPVIFAAQTSEELQKLMARKFCKEGDANRARQIVLESDGIEKTRELARKHSEEAARMVCF